MIENEITATFDGNIAATNEKISVMHHKTFAVEEKWVTLEESVIPVLEKKLLDRHIRIQVMERYF